MITRHVEIRPGEKYWQKRLIIDGIDLSKYVSNVSISIRADSVPVVLVEIPAEILNIDLPDCLVQIIKQNKTGGDQP